jgi:hypothetical protein
MREIGALQGAIFCRSVQTQHFRLALQPAISLMVSLSNHTRYHCNKRILLFPAMSLRTKHVARSGFSGTPCRVIVSAMVQPFSYRLCAGRVQSLRPVLLRTAISTTNTIKPTKGVLT